MNKNKNFKENKDEEEDIGFDYISPDAWPKLMNIMDSLPEFEEEDEEDEEDGTMKCGVL